MGRDNMPGFERVSEADAAEARRILHLSESQKREERITAQAERRREEQDKRTLLAQDLRQKYLIERVPDEVAKRVFDKAWEDGHASGTYEVEQQYDDLSEVVNAAFKAGQDVR